MFCGEREHTRDGEFYVGVLLRTFAFIKLLLQLGNEILMSEMQKR